MLHHVRRAARVLPVLSVVLFLSWPVHAEETLAPVIVSISEAAAHAGLEPERLVVALEAELKRPVRRSGTEGTDAAGSLVFDVEEGKLHVAYIAHAAPLRRSVALPPDAKSVALTAVALAGNLARDEAGELAARLRASPPKGEATPAKPAAPAKRSEQIYPNEEDIAAMRARETVAQNARSLARELAAVGTAKLIAGVGVTLMAPLVAHDPGLLGGVGGLGGYLAGTGIDDLTTKNPFQALMHDDEERKDDKTLEERWADLARDEQRGRRRFAIFELAMSGLLIGLGAFVLAYEPLDVRKSRRHDTAGLFFAGGTAFAMHGVYTLSTDGPVESALRAYEAATGRRRRAAEARSAMSFGVAPLRSGAFGSFSVTF